MVTVFFIFVVLLVVILIIKLAKVCKIPIKCEKAKVISKTKARRGKIGTCRRYGNFWYITFEIEQKIIDIRVPYLMIDSINEGDEGILFYKGNIFVSFKKTE